MIKRERDLNCNNKAVLPLVTTSECLMRDGLPQIAVAADRTSATLGLEESRTTFSRRQTEISIFQRENLESERI